MTISVSYDGFIFHTERNIQRVYSDGLALFVNGTEFVRLDVDSLKQRWLLIE